MTVSHLTLVDENGEPLSESISSDLLLAEPGDRFGDYRVERVDRQLIAAEGKLRESWMLIELVTLRECQTPTVEGR